MLNSLYYDGMDAETRAVTQWAAEPRKQPEPQWPDFSVDNRAFEKAKAELGEEHPDLYRRAQEIKDELKKKP